MECRVLRIFLKISDPTIAVGFIEENFSSYLYVVESGKDGDNPHVQAVVWSDVKSRAMCARIRKVFGKGNKVFSYVLARDPVKAGAYLLKEDDWLQGEQYNNLTPEYIAEVQVYDDKVKKSLKSRGNMFSQIVEYITMERLLEIINNGYGVEKQLVKLVIQFHLDNDKLLQTHRIISYVQTMIAKYSEKGLDYLAEKISTNLMKIF